MELKTRSYLNWKRPKHSIPNGNSQPKCENCGKLGHTKAKCWAKGGGQEGQYLKRYNLLTINSITDTPIVWTNGSKIHPDVWFADSAATIHVSPNQKDFVSYRRYDNERNINTFSNNLVKGTSEGDIDVKIECGGKIMKI